MEGYAPPNGANHQDAGTSWTGLPPPPPPPPFAPQPQQQQQPLAGPSHLPPHPHGYHPDYHPQQPPPPPSLISPELSSNGVGVSPASTAADTPNSTGGARGGVGGAATGKGAKGKGKKRAGSVDGAEKVDKDGNAKKKRKQLVACDSCRLRRVKCDKAEKEEGKDCTECEKKSITCTDTYVKNKPKVVRGGKLIAQAKALYGNKPEGENGGPAPNGAPSSSAGPSSCHNSIDELRRASAGSVGPVNPSEGRLMSADVGHEISEHLIRTYFDHLHPQCPLVDEESFMAMFEAAGKRAEGMTPANECLCLVIQAWAARFSSHLLIAGPGAPALSELRTAGRDFTKLGNRRDEFALAMRDRALAACDRHGLLRTSSAAACAALTLLEFLVTWNDPHRSSTCGRYLLTTAIEHLRHLQLGKCDDPTEEVLPPERVSNGTLLWMCYTRDALASLLGGRSLSLTEDDLALFCDLFVSQLTANAEPYVTSSDARMLSGLAVAAIFRFGVGSIRTTVGRLTSPLARRSQVEEQTLRDIWASVDELTRLQSLFRASVDTASFGPEAPKTDVWFRDLVAIKSQHQLGIHANLTSRLEEEGGRTETTDGGAYGELLTRLKGESEARMLDVSREYAGMLHSYGSELMYSAAFSVEYPASYLTCMVEVPALEQGGGNEGWTWVQKVEEISSFLEALKLVGWAWPRFDQLIGNARNSLAEQSSRLQHQHQALVAKQGSYPTPDYDAPHPQHLYHDSAVSQQQQDWRSASFSGPPVNGVVGHYAQPQPQPQAHLPMLPPSRPQSSAYAYTPASEAYSETSTSYTSYSQPALPSHLSQQSSVTPPPHLSGHSQPQHQHQQPPSNSFFDYSLQPSGALPPGGEDGLVHNGGQQHRGSV